jgi:hypothetical protein
MRLPVSCALAGAFALASLSWYPAAAGPARPDLRISDFYQDRPAAYPVAVAPRKPEGLARALNIVLDGKTLPIPCASSLLQDLRRHREALGDPARDALRLLSQRPAIDRDGARATRNGRYTIHYSLDDPAFASSDRDSNGAPDRVDQVEATLEQAEAILVEKLGWPAPASGIRGGRYDVYLVDLGELRHGFTISDRDIASTPQDDAYSHVVLDASLEGDALTAAVAHQVAHAALLGLSTKAPVWWTEATAAWMEMQVTGTPLPQREPLAHRLEHLEVSLATDSLLLAAGNSLWASFLADRREDRGEGIRQIWTELSLRSSEPLLPLMDEVLRRSGQGSLVESYGDFTRWSLFTGGRDDGDHFRNGALLPAPELPTHAAFPAESAGMESVEPLGASIVRFSGDGSRGGLKIRLDAEVPSPIEVDLIVSPFGAARPHRVELTLDARGHAEAGIPWRGVKEAVMIVRHAALDGAPARFRYTAQIDPVYPFDLASFSALPSAGAITLQWATSLETDVLGWNVYRSSQPKGPFVRLNALPLPSGADTLEETDYLYQDASVQPHRRYFYLVEAITVLGLPERSMTLSAQSQAAGQQD